MHLDIQYGVSLKSTVSILPRPTLLILRSVVIRGQALWRLITPPHLDGKAGEEPPAQPPDFEVGHLLERRLYQIATPNLPIRFPPVQAEVVCALACWVGYGAEGQGNDAADLSGVRVESGERDRGEGVVRDVGVDLARDCCVCGCVESVGGVYVTLRSVDAGRGKLVGAASEVGDGTAKLPWYSRQSNQLRCSQNDSL